jgi:hypothetical protein
VDVRNLELFQILGLIADHVRIDTHSLKLGNLAVHPRLRLR